MCQFRSQQALPAFDGTRGSRVGGVLRPQDQVKVGEESKGPTRQGLPASSLFRVCPVAAV